MTDVLVIGGGPAGMMAAITAADAGRSVLLLERNEKTGKKLYLTGKGRCNVTNNCDRETFFAHVAHNPRFLYAAYAAFPPRSTMDFFETAGVPLKVERGQRVFPQSDKSSDILRALDREAARCGVRVRLGTRARTLLIDEGVVCGAVLDGGEQVRASHVIVATGGISYPSTGSTGDGYAFARASGHRVEDVCGSLVPIVSDAEWIPPLTGLSLKNVALIAKRGTKTIFDEQGELVFTHFGISGPLALTLSTRICGESLADIALYIDLKPALDEAMLDARLVRELTASPQKLAHAAIRTLVPESLAEAVRALSGITPDASCASVTRESRKRIGSMLKRLSVSITGFRPAEEAIITRGGVRTTDVSPSTMRSRRTAGLSFAGEVLDVDAETGGFNLQIAFSTGYLAGMHAYADKTEE